MTNQRDALKNIRTFPQLIKFLRDELEWPIDSDDFEELTFDYTPEELGIDSANAAKIQEIKRLRPLSASQPWGIFFVKFEPKRLPVVALRRVLSRVVLKKRASANSAERAAWKADDLLFISNYGEGDERQINFGHFSQDAEKADLPTLKVLGWDNRDTPLHLDDVAETLHQKLAWPEDESDAKRWRDQWRSAFTLGHREVITTSRELAVRLAALARAIRTRIQAVLAIETDRGPLTRLMTAFQEALIHDLNPDDFADMYAQTIAYGLLSARVANPSHKTADAVATHIPITNPFLKELMETFLHLGGRKKAERGGNGIDFDELGVNEVVELLDAANMEAVVRDFGDRNRDEDPVIHFYELFLKEYDAKKRMQRGVFYTPQPVVSYIVRSVHELLQTEFGLEDGLASTVTWSEVSRKKEGLKIPNGIDSDEPFVQILDVATGTATFLVEVIELIYDTLVAKWKQQRLSETQQRTAWNEYVPKHLLPRLHGFELMMAPYAIAHMKIGLKLHETGYDFGSNERARIYLTNSLEPASDEKKQREFEQMAPALAHEAQAVNSIKRSRRFTAVIGNPPYSVSSWNTGPWITNLTEDYKRTVRGEESQIQSLSNDYIKFLRFAEWNIEQSGAGIVGLITGHGYLHGTQPRDLRHHVSTTFDRCYCLDLHGSIRRVGTADTEDEPVFQIMTGVAIIVGVRRASHGEGMAALNSLTGRLEKKFEFLAKRTAYDVASDVTLHRPLGPYFHFAPSETAKDVADEYQGCLDLPEIFGTGNRQSDKEVYWATGFASQQDDLAMSFTNTELQEKMAALAESRSFESLKDHYRLCTTDQWNYNEAKEFARRGLWRDFVGQVAYRPFDRRWTVLNKNVLTILRKQVMSQLGGGTEHNLGLISSRAVNDLSFAHCFVTNEPVDKIFISSKTSTNAYVFPLFYRHDDPLLGSQRRPNFSSRFLGLLARTLGVRQAADGVPEGLTAEDIFNYVYGVFYSPSYRNRYAEFLKVDFPRLPLTGNPELFRTIARFGSELVALHLLEASRPTKLITTYVGTTKPEVEKISYSRETVWVDRAETKGFSGVPEAVWKFHVGGYQVCEKWLKDRKGRSLSKDDIAHYQKLVVALSETIRLMAEIDKTIDAYGGWPGAFYAESPSAAQRVN